MHLPQELKTDRLLLRRWAPADREPFAALNADPRVVEHLPAALSRQESDALAARIEAHFDEHGFGLWAVEFRGVAPFAGFAGLSIPAFQSALHAVRGDRLAPGSSVLGPRVRVGSRARVRSRSASRASGSARSYPSRCPAISAPDG